LKPTKKLKPPRRDRYGTTRAQQRVITQMVRWRSQGKSGAEIAAILNARKVPPARGSRWSKSSVIAFTNRASAEAKSAQD